MVNWVASSTTRSTARTEITGFLKTSVVFVTWFLIEEEEGGAAGAQKTVSTIPNTQNVAENIQN